MAQVKFKKRNLVKPRNKFNIFKKYISREWLVLISIVVLTNLLILAWNYKQSNKPIIIGEWPTPTTTRPTPTAAPAAAFPNDYRTKHYNPSAAFTSANKFTYADLIPTDDDLLVKTSCSLNYNLFAGEYDTVYVGSIRQKVNPKVVNYIEALKDPQSKKIMEIMACTDGNKTVVFYNVVCGGGCLGPTVAIFKNDNLIKQIDIPNSIGMPYYGCRNFLELTKSNDIYMDCGGGDGSGGGSTLFKLNLDNYILSPLKSCTTIDIGTNTVCK